MSWTENLQDAAFRGVKFDCLRAQDSAQRDTTNHEYPYIDGADVEDLGRKARRVSMSAVFFGKDYENRVRAFITELDKQGPGELMHPVFGSMPKAQLTDYQISHDADNPDYCTIELSFVEATPGNPFFVQQLPAQVAAVVKQKADITDAMSIDAFSQAVATLKSYKDSASSNIAAFRDLLMTTTSRIKTAVQDILAKVYGYVAEPLKAVVGFVHDVSTLAKQFTTDLVGAVKAVATEINSSIREVRNEFKADKKAVMTSWKGMQKEIKELSRLPQKIVDELKDAADGRHAGQANTPSAQEVAMLSAFIEASAATTLADLSGDILAMQAQEPTLSPLQIEALANDVREMLEQGIDTHRQLYDVEVSRSVTEPLKDIALSVQQAATSIIDARPPLIIRTLEAPGNLYMAAHRWYGDYSRVEELIRLNPQLRNPNAIEPGEMIYAYAQ